MMKTVNFDLDAMIQRHQRRFPAKRAIRRLRLARSGWDPRRSRSVIAPRTRFLLGVGAWVLSARPSACFTYDGSTP